MEVFRIEGYPMVGAKPSIDRGRVAPEGHGEDQ